MNSEFYRQNYAQKINQQYNFTNEVYPSKDNVRQTNNMLCNGNIMLEPRLQEYIKKKKFYKQNNILLDVSIEREFGITNKDRKIIKDFISGKRNMYIKGNKYNEPKNNNSNYSHKIFPSKTYRDNDSRVLTNNTQQQKDIPNRGMFYSDKFEDYYEKDMEPLNIQMDSRDFNGSTVEKYNNDEHMNHLFMTDNQHDTQDGWSIKTQYKPNNTRFNPRNDPKIDPIMGNHMENKYDSQYRINSDYNYKMPNNINNSDLETQLIRGMPTNNKSKTYGYRNVDEHYYDYISDDFQHPDNVVLPFPRGGEGTRQYDKGLARNNYLYKNNRDNC
jgi:hypothetical protein